MIVEPDLADGHAARMGERAHEVIGRAGRPFRRAVRVNAGACVDERVRLRERGHGVKARFIAAGLEHIADAGLRQRREQRVPVRIEPLIEQVGMGVKDFHRYRCLPCRALPLLKNVPDNRLCIGLGGVKNAAAFAGLGGAKNRRASAPV